MFSCAASWGEQEGLMRTPAEEESRAGAQVNWIDWWAEQRRYLERMRKTVATHGKRNSKQKEAKKAVTRFCNEIEWLSYALRD